MTSNNFEVKRDDKYGRYLVAAKDLKRGTRIFSDVPFAIGPKPDSPPVCLGCYRLWDGKYRCSECNWPCCNESCEEISWHKDFECKIFAEANAEFQPVSNPSVPCPQFDCITPLRILLAKEKNPEKWEKDVAVMEDHKEERMKRSTWFADDINIVQYLRGPCQLEERFSEDLIQKVCGILEVNAVEVPALQRPNVRGIYPAVAIMSHNCKPTVTHTIVSGGKNEVPRYLMMKFYSAEVWAADNIKKGEKLEMCYTHVFSSTIQRRDYLLQSKFFACDCDRCKDPTELGTNMSTLKCNKCDDGLVLPENPLDEKTEWKCSSCNYTTDNEQVRKLIQTVEKENNLIEESAVPGTEIVLKEQAAKWYSSFFHQKHSLIVGLKYGLSQQYGHCKGYFLDDMSVTELKRKVTLCQEIIDTLEIICPGQTRMKATSLYELHAPLLVLNRLEYKEGKITEKRFKERMAEIAELLHESAEILLREDPRSEKGLLGKAAMKSYKELILTL